MRQGGEAPGAAGAPPPNDECDRGGGAAGAMPRPGRRARPKAETKGGVRGGGEPPRQKVKVGNCPKSWVKILRTTVGRRGWGRRHENGAFDTEIFR